MLQPNIFQTQRSKLNHFNVTEVTMAPSMISESEIELKPFSMRQATMANFVINEKRSIYRAHAMSVSRYREDYLVQDAEKSKQLLQELLQDKMNADIHALLSNYYDSYFKPALCNIRSNLKNDQEYKEVTTKQLFRDILDKAKKMYEDRDLPSPTVNKTPVTPQSPYCRTRGRPRGSKQKLKLKAKTRQNNQQNVEVEKLVSSAKKKVVEEKKKETSVADLYTFESEPSSPSVEDTFDLMSSNSPNAAT